jgi:hypothetical protein
MLSSVLVLLNISFNAFLDLRGLHVRPLCGAETGTTKVAEARNCVSQSHRFKGACLSSNNCANVCRTENFPDGECRAGGIQRKCYCKKIC